MYGCTTTVNLLYGSILMDTGWLIKIDFASTVFFVVHLRATPFLEQLGDMCDKLYLKHNISLHSLYLLNMISKTWFIYVH